MSNCQRCGIETVIHTMSMFNQDTICLDCANKERRHHDYQKARDAELEAVKNGDMNFPGIGLPDSLKKKIAPTQERVDKICPHCGVGKLIYCHADEPYSDEHYICEECDSTYSIDSHGNIIGTTLEEKP